MITVTLPLPPSVNAMYRAAGRRVIKSEEYRAWITAAGWKLNQQRPGSILGPICVSVVVGETRADLDNLLKAQLDLLVRHRVIEGDGPAIVRKINLALDESIEGCVVTIEACSPDKAA